MNRPVDAVDAAGPIEKLREEVHDKDALSKNGQVSPTGIFRL